MDRTVSQFHRHQSGIDTLAAIALGASTALLWIVVASQIGMDLSDEGYYWYGAQRVAAGDFPIRDFMAYDPGRYLYAGTIFRFLGRSDLFAARLVAASLIGVCAAFAGHVVLTFGRRNRLEPAITWGSAGAVSLLFVVWTYPYYKVFDLLCVTAYVWCLYRLLVERNRITAFRLGLVVGVAAIVGRNHGLYGVAASVMGFLVLSLTEWRGRVDLIRMLAWLVGLVLGYLPLLVMLLVVHGFAEPFIAGVLDHVHAAGSNISLPVPWPWTVDVQKQGMVLSLSPLALGLGFVLLIAFPLIMLWRLARDRAVTDANAVLLASSLVALPYAHYAFSRADLTHLVLPCVPILACGFALPRATRPLLRAAIASSVVVFSVAILYETPAVNYRMTSQSEWATLDVGGVAVRVPVSQAVGIRRRLDIIEFARANQASYLALPNMPTLHAMTEARMPVHDIYVLSQGTPDEEQAEIAKLRAARTSTILISNLGLDGLDSWRFSSLRPMTYAWINQNYEKTVSTNARGKDPLEIYRLIPVR